MTAPLIDWAKGPGYVRAYTYSTLPISVWPKRIFA
jgi:hypothetical protein